MRGLKLSRADRDMLLIIMDHFTPQMSMAHEDYMRFCKLHYELKRSFNSEKIGKEIARLRHLEINQIIREARKR